MTTRREKRTRGVQGWLVCTEECSAVNRRAGYSSMGVMLYQMPLLARYCEQGKEGWGEPE